mgnify:CR=1 FL=1
MSVTAGIRFPIYHTPRYLMAEDRFDAMLDGLVRRGEALSVPAARGRRARARVRTASIRGSRAIRDGPAASREARAARPHARGDRGALHARHLRRPPRRGRGASLDPRRDDPVAGRESAGRRIVEERSLIPRFRERASMRSSRLLFALAIGLRRGLGGPGRGPVDHGVHPRPRLRARDARSRSPARVTPCASPTSRAASISPRSASRPPVARA